MRRRAVLSTILRCAAGCLFLALSSAACDSGDGGSSADATVSDDTGQDAATDQEPAGDAHTNEDTAPEFLPDLCVPDCEPGYSCDEGFCAPNCALLCAGMECGTAGTDGECPCGDCGDCGDCQAPFCADGACGCEPEDGPCDDDDQCTEDDVCADGACIGLAEKNCDDGNACTADGCEEGFCWHDPGAMQDATCDDGNPCTGPDICAVGICAGPLLPPEEAPDGECLCEEDEDCAPIEDGDVCNGTLACVVPEDANSGTCQVDLATIPDCDDEIDCTADICEPQVGCQNTPDDGGCDDGVDCTVDVCDPVEGCQSSTDDGGCDDGVPCTVDVCDPVEGCLAAPDDGGCDDGIACTVENCDPVEGCLAAPDDGLCDDGVACTADACDPVEGCLATPDNALCDDGVACTNDVCEPLVGCQSTPDDMLCDDNVGCTLDHCDAVDGCEFIPSDPLCEDGIPCTADSCHPQDDCLHSPDDDLCDDGISCTLDACTPGQGCTHQPDHGFCADEFDCTVDSCDALQGCKYLTYDSLCDDNVDCTADACLAGQGCVFTPQDGTCDDGIGCTVDSCHPQNDCVNQPEDAICEDNNDCTADTCSPTLDCVHTPQNEGNNCGEGGAVCDGGECLFNCDGAGQWEWIDSKGIDTSHQIAQVIVPEDDGYLQSVELLIWASQAGGVLADLKIDVVTLSGGAPTGTVLQSASLSPWMLPTTPEEGLTFIFFNPAPPLTAGQPVALRLSSPGTTGGLPHNGYHWAVSCEAFGMPDVYPPGQLFTAGPGPWTAEACDAFFLLYLKQTSPCGE